jgi:hypothetical protein
MAKKKSNRIARTKPKSSSAVRPDLPGDIRHLIEAAREQTARAANSTLVLMYWQIGKRIHQDVLQN